MSVRQAENSPQINSDTRLQFIRCNRGGKFNKRVVYQLKCFFKHACPGFRGKRTLLAGRAPATQSLRNFDSS